MSGSSKGSSEARVISPVLWGRSRVQLGVMPSPSSGLSNPWRMKYTRARKYWMSGARRPWSVDSNPVI